jgi:exonuclease VII small subunit
VTKLSYLKAFAKSWEHAAMALLTVGAAFASGEPLGLVAGAAAYVLGWVFIGDSGWFRRKIDAAELSRLSAEEEKTLEKVQAEREALLRRLPAEARRRYAALAGICRNIEEQLGAAGGEETYPVEKLDGLMWSFLGLLGSEANLDEFVAREKSEDFGARIAEIEADVRALEGEVAAAEPGSREYETRMQLIASKQEGLEAVRRRHQQFLRAGENLRLVRAEQDRVSEQLKLLRADLYASKAVGQISQRVNDTIDQLASSGRLGAEVAPAIQELPALRTRRVGYKLQAE